jgi:Ca2+-transporting ATPase
MSKTSDFEPGGLTGQEAEARLRVDGPNALPRPERRSLRTILLDVLREPMLVLLIVGGLLYLALGDLSEAVLLLVFALLSVVITLLQEVRTERVLEALRDLTSPRALVIRDGERKRIAGTDVVRGDLVVLSEGDRVPADARLIQCDNLLADESLLTGESVPVRKTSDYASVAAPRPGGEDLGFVFSGSLVVRGSGLAVVIATGPRSEIGRIGRALSAMSNEPSGLQTETRRMVRIFGVAAGVVCFSALLIQGLMRGGWLKAFLSAIALGMAMLPEEFPVVLTVFMAMGAWRISRARVLTRRAAAIEALGAATVLCTDKTGTLTENRMSVAELQLADGEIFRPAANAVLPGAFHELTRYSVLASQQNPFDPMEKALHRLNLDIAGGEGQRALSDWRIVQSFGLRPGLLAMTQVWETPAGRDHLIIAAKGASEAILALCRCDEMNRAKLTGWADRMAAEGLRVLGVARATAVGGRVPDNPRELDFTFVGFVGLADPLRSSVPASVAECRNAGIRVVMITGDYPVTARAIAGRAGIDGSRIVTGDTLKAMTDTELAEQVRATSVFARIMPEQKLRIVNALKASGQVVAMTGDGVNDAPSLKAAHIGIAMGGRGTDVAREAAAIVLLDDDFSAIVKAIRLGRRIYDNLRKAMAFIFAVHVPIVGLAFLPLLFGLPVLLGPVHIAVLEMIIDPVCALVFEAEDEEENIMRRAPRAPDRPLFSIALIAWGLFQGVIALVLTAAIFFVGLRAGMPEGEVRALTFFSLVMAVIGLVFVNRSFSASPFKALRRPGAALLAVVAAVAGMLFLTMVWPYARNLFGFGLLPANYFALAIAAGAGVMVTLELAKSLWRR